MIEWFLIAGYTIYYVVAGAPLILKIILVFAVLEIIAMSVGLPLWLLSDVLWLGSLVLRLALMPVRLLSTVWRPFARWRYVPLPQKNMTRATFGGFLVAQQAAKRMVPRGQGAILLTGASASVKGFALSAPFAMGKFALRGLAQSAARELAPKGIHVAHFVIDGGVRSAVRPDPFDRPDSTLDPDAIAQCYLDVLRQPRSAWSWEVELRPWVESF